MGFFSKFFAVQADKGADALVTLLANWDPTGATEAEKRMIAEKLAEFCVKCEEAKRKMQKEEADVVAVKQQYANKLQLAKNWDAEIRNPATDPARREDLQNNRLPKLMQELQEFGPKIDKEVKEAELAKKVFETYDQVVIATNRKLQQKIAQGEQLTSELEIARAEKALVEEQVDAARVLNGLKTATDSFDVASGAIKRQTDKLRDQTAGMQREAELLTVSSKDDDFVAAELARMNGVVSSEKSITEQLAELEAKVK